MKWVLAFYACVASLAAKDWKNTLDEKICKLGLTFVGPSDVAKGTTCMEPHFYAETPVENMTDPAVGCVIGAVPFMKYMTALSLKTKMDKCVAPLDTFGLLEKLFPAIAKAADKVYKKVMGKIAKAKSYGKSESYVTNESYKMFVACITRPLIEYVCKKMIPLLTKVEWDCMRDVGKDLWDFGQYECAKI